MIEIQWLASILRQNDKNVELQNIQNNAKLQNRSNYNDLHRLDGNTIKTNLNLNYKKWSKSNDLHRFKRSKQSLQTWSKSNDLIDLRRKTIQKNLTLNYKPVIQIPLTLHRLDGKTIKTKLNYKSDRNPMTCIDFTSKR